MVPVNMVPVNMMPVNMMPAVELDVRFCGHGEKAGSHTLISETGC